MERPVVDSILRSSRRSNFLDRTRRS
jgi:hypothetical protein